jgi:hypothetical protein
MSDDGNKTEQPEGVTPDAPEGGVTPSAADEAVTAPDPKPDEAPVTRADLEKVTAALTKERDANKDLRSKIKGLVDPDEAQQQVKTVEDQLTAITHERDRAVSDALRFRVALEAGITTVKGAMRLVGDTEEELRADAAEYLAEFPQPPKVGTPHAKVGAGENGGQPEKTLQAQIEEAQAAGDTRKVIRLNNQKLAAARAAVT